MAYKKKKVTQNISDFDNHKKICELKKAHSPATILFCTEDLPDEWLIDVLEYKTKSGVITENYGVNAKSMPGYIDFLGKCGFDKITNF